MPLTRRIGKLGGGLPERDAFWVDDGVEAHSSL